MARKTTPATTANRAPALLAKPREEVRATLLSRIDLGNDIVASRGSGSFENAKEAYSRWNDYNAEFLRRAFTTEEYAEKYNHYVGAGVFFVGPGSNYDRVGEFYEKLGTRVERLRSLAERLDLIDELPGVDNVAVPENPLRLENHATPTTNRIFLVHGQDDEAKAVVARFIASCSLEPIILHEQANGGRTVIEKFEKEADVGFAVVLLTPDDVGGIRLGGQIASDDLKARARQNVILELGYFAGRLGRGRVAALKKGELELPSDIAGVVWTAMDSADAWKMSLARELKAAGYDFDVAKALGI